MSEIKALYSQFTLVGEVLIPNKAEQFCKPTEKDGRIGNRMSFAIKSSDTNSVFVELQGGYKKDGSTKVHTLDKDNKKLELNWQDRNIQTIKENVASFKKIKVQLEPTAPTEEFLTEYDAIQHLKHLRKGQRYEVTGDIQFGRYYNDKTNKTVNTVKYIPKTIMPVGDDVKNKAEAVIHFVFDKDSMDESRFKEDKCIDFRGYVTSYDSESKKQILLPLDMVLNGTKFDFNNQEHKEKFDFARNALKVKDKKYHAAQWRLGIVKGVGSEDVKESDLSDFQRTQIKLGLKSFEEIVAGLPRKAGDKVNELRLIAPTEKYADGHEVVEYEEEDFIVPELTPKREKFEGEPKAETKAEVKSEPKKEDNKPPFDTDDDLFN